MNETYCDYIPMAGRNAQLWPVLYDELGAGWLETDRDTAVMQTDYVRNCGHRFREMEYAMAMLANCNYKLVSVHKLVLRIRAWI